jgi:transposase
MKSPAQSPDLNPIEWVWSDLKQFVAKRKCCSLDDLVEAVSDFEETMTPEYCQKYIKKLPEV